MRQEGAFAPDDTLQGTAFWSLHVRAGIQISGRRLLIEMCKNCDKDDIIDNACKIKSTEQIARSLVEEASFAV